MPARVRYPDVSVVRDAGIADTDRIDPTVVFEVTSPATARSDRHAKPSDYASVPSIQAYVILDSDRPEATVMRRTNGWEAEEYSGADATIPLPEIGVNLPLAAVYAV
jgi:Uma2 family endonuclease